MDNPSPLSTTTTKADVGGGTTTTPSSILRRSPPPKSAFIVVDHDDEDEDHDTHQLEDVVSYGNDDDDGPKPDPPIDDEEFLDGIAIDVEKEGGAGNSTAANDTSEDLSSSESSSSSNIITNFYYKYLYAIDSLICGQRCCNITSKKSFIIKILIGLFVIAIVVVIPTIFVVKYNKSVGGGFNEDDDSSSSSIVHISDHDRDVYYGRLVRILQDTTHMMEGFDGLKIDRDSPTKHALEWLAYKDNDIDLIWNIVKKYDEQDHLPHYYQQRVTQRFALLALYYGMGGGSVLLGAVSGGYWNSTHHDSQHDVNVKPIEGWATTKNSIRHECDWSYVGCTYKGAAVDPLRTSEDDDGVVTSLDLHGRPGMTLTSSTGSLPIEMALLTNLQTLDLSNNNLEGTVPQEWMKSLSNLEKVQVQFNPNLTIKVSDLLQSFPNLIHLDVSQTLLLDDDDELPKTGPKHISGSSSKLEVLKVSGTTLKGSIPTEIGTVWGANLQELSIGRSELTGVLPTQLGLLTHLKKLQIDFATKMGPGSTLPTELGLLTDLEIFDLQFSKLEGTLPIELSKLTNLVLLDVSGNIDITGTFPTEYSALTNLDQVHINDISLTGSISDEFCDSTTLKEFKADCKDDDQIVCDCCLEC